MCCANILLEIRVWYESQQVENDHCPFPICDFLHARFLNSVWIQYLENLCSIDFFEVQDLLFVRFSSINFM